MSFENEQYVSNRVDRIEALEQELTRLKKQLEVFKKLAMFNKEEAEKYHDRFKEAVEVIEDLKTKLNSALGELGYSVPGDTPILYKCGLCDARENVIAEARKILKTLLGFNGIKSQIENEEKARAWLEANK